MTAFRPEPQTLLSVNEPTVTGTPAYIAACLARFCPSPAEMTFPRMTSSTSPPFRLLRLMASLTTVSPSLAAETRTRLLPNFPMGVLQAERITGFAMVYEWAPPPTH